MPALRARATPCARSWRTTTTPSIAPSASAVPSDEPSSTTTISVRTSCWARTPATASSTRSRRSLVGITTLTSGSLGGRPSPMGDADSRSRAHGRTGRVYEAVLARHGPGAATPIARDVEPPTTWTTRMPAALALAVGLLLLWGAVAAHATTYYVARDGSDANPGTSPAQPLATLAAAADLELQPGDRLLLRAGDTFDGSLVFDGADNGTAAQPVTAGSYGQGRATIHAPADGFGVISYDNEHLVVQDLRVEG